MEWESVERKKDTKDATDHGSDQTATHNGSGALSIVDDSYR